MSWYNHEVAKSYDTIMIPGATSVVFDQQGCNLCGSFAVCSFVSNTLSIERGTPAPVLSPSHVIDCSVCPFGSAEEIAAIEKNGFLTYDLLNFARDSGIHELKDYPLVRYKQHCQQKTGDKHSIFGWKHVPLNELEMIRQLQKSSLILQIKVDPTFMLLKNDEVWYGPPSNPPNLRTSNHDVELLRAFYLEDKDVNVWVIKNSYGESWGNKGIGYMIRDIDRKSGFLPFIKNAYAPKFRGEAVKDTYSKEYVQIPDLLL